MKKHYLFNRLLTIISAILFIAISNGHAAAAAVHPVNVNAAANGAFGNERTAIGAQISADGRFLVFASKASNLIPGLTDNNNTYDIFARDLKTGTLRCLSRKNGAMSTGNSSSDVSKISDDGRYVVFDSLANDLVTNDGNPGSDIFRYDLETDQISLVSVNNAGNAAGNSDSSSSEISADGRYIAFLSLATDLIPGFADGNGANLYDLFIRDMQTGTTRLVSAAAGSTTTGGNNNSFVTLTSFPYKIVAGRFVIFNSYSSNLVLGLNDTNGVADIFVRDLQTGQTVCASVTPAGNTTGNSISLDPNISEDGRRVFFNSEAENLVPNDANGMRDVFMRDMQTGTTRLVSVNLAGTGSGNNLVLNAPLSITPDGRFVVFAGKATNLAGGVNYTPEIVNTFVRDTQAGITRLVSIDPTGTEAARQDASAGRAAITADGRFVAFSSPAKNLVFEDTNNFNDAYVRDLKADLTILLSWNHTETNGGNSDTATLILAAKARRAVYGSRASDLVPGTNAVFNTYYADFFATKAPVADFDGDGKSDYAVFRPQLNSPWYVFLSSNNLATYRFWGAETDLIAPADYNGDRYADYAVYRPSNGTWHISDGATFASREVRFGLAGDIPVPGDFDGDERADIAVFRPSDGVWYILRSSDGQVAYAQFGIAGDIPVIGDFDGDARDDVAVFRPSDGVWHVLRSADNSYFAVRFGLAGDKPVTGDYDGDGKSEIAVFRQGVWYILRSSNLRVDIVNWGLGGDIATPADYDGDGRYDIAVWRPSEGVWYALGSSNNAPRYAHFGQTGDRPAPAAFIP
jgi:hypothetical protein